LLPGTPVDLGIGEPRAGGAALDHLGDRVAGHRPGADGAGLVHHREQRPGQVGGFGEPGAANYYFPPADIRSDALITDDGTSWCEWKGQARYHTVRGADRVVRRAAWSYPTPNPAYAELAGMVAFYPALMDACFVDDERARAQPGGFYGGWITRDVVGPFKGAPGTNWW